MNRTVNRPVNRNAGITGHRAAQTTQDPRWSLVLARDKSADGRFWY